MSSESWTSTRKSANVAARIQAFQDVQALNQHSSKTNPRPRVMTIPLEYGTTTGRGRRSDSSFASPAGRASRDGNEGVRGDGRPPVGNVVHKIHPATETSEIPQRPQLRGAPRPQLGVKEASNEAVKMRLRLRSVIAETKEEENQDESEPMEQKKGEESDTSTVRKKSKAEETLEELGDLLDNAIEEAGGDNKNDSLEQRSPQALRRWRSVKGPARPSKLPETVHRSRSVAYRRKPDSTPTQVVDAAPSVASPPMKATTEKQHPTEDVVQEPAELTIPQTKNVQTGPSPVKERAAMFERLMRRSSAPKAVHTPPIQLALPRLLGPRPQRLSPQALGSPHGVEEGFLTPPESTPHAANAPGSEVEKISSRWPFKWEMLNKTPAASPQQTDVQAPADTLYKQSATSIRSKVQSLVAAANRSSSAEGKQKKPKGEYSQSSSKQIATHAEASSAQVCPEQQQFQPQPLKPSASEKEVLAQLQEPPKAPPERSGSQSPIKRDPSMPSTPIRGRPFTNPKSPSKKTHAVDQRFALSRSRSRGGTIRVQVEVRTSPERVSDEAVVTVRADVDSMSEDMGEAMHEV